MDELIAYLGPAIGPQKFEVGVEVQQAFCTLHLQSAACFIPSGNKYLADIIGLAKLRLSLLGINPIYSADICTVSDTDYFSYRRDKVTGRMASLI
ncbi:laccase domain-containing protein, partial [Klebsiella pneumoniae]